MDLVSKESPADAQTGSVSSECSSHLGLPLDTVTFEVSAERDGARDHDPTQNVIKTEHCNKIENKVSETEKLHALEDRVQDLEAKLLLVTRMLQLQACSSSNNPVNAFSVFTDSLETPKHREEDKKLHHSISHNSQPLQAQLEPLSDHNPSNHFPLTPSTKHKIHNHVTLLYHSSSKETGTAAVPHLESPARVLGLDQDESMGCLSPDPPSFTNENNLLPVDNPSPQTNHEQSQSTPSFSQKTTTESTPRRPMGIKTRNLSFKLLYGGDEEAYQQQRLTDPSATASLTPFERRWLGNMVWRAQQELTQQRELNVPDENVRHKWLNYLNSFQESTPDVDLQMEEFVKVPGNLESIMAFGFYICVDSFLYIFTILPIRFVWSCLLLMLRILTSWRPKPITGPLHFHRRHTYQMIQVFMLYIIYQYVLAPISIGKVYHWVRGQAMIKLYVVLSIVDVFDRLMCSMGQDCLDSMYWNAVNRPRSSRMLISVAVVLLYTTCHTLLLFLHAATLNVAMNSADHALLTLFISGNFAEVKSNVFKKYNTPALFKLTVADICERFKLALFLGLVLILNVCQGMDQGQFMGYVRVCAIVWMSELLADWIKHAFIIKFNVLSANVYLEYTLLLAGDFTGIGHEGVNLDHSHAVVKRIGFAQLPLVCVTFRLLREAAKYASINGMWDWSATDQWMVCLFVSAAWLFLLALKVALGSLLQRISLQKLRNAPEILPSSSSKKVKKS